MEYITLNNGVKMPMIGFGTYQIPPEETERCVSEAISVGYRSIDTAQAYRNEKEVGDAIRNSGIPREEFFITSKIWISNAGYEKAKASIEKTLERLQIDYIDLLLVHQPFNDYYGTYRAMEEAYKNGKIRAIGVSNFVADRFIDIASFVDVVPAIDQMESHVFQQQKIARKYLDKFQTVLMASSPLAQGKNNLFHHELLSKIGEKYGKSAAQVNLRFLIQSGIIIIPKSTHRSRMKENFDLFDFELTQNEMAELETLDLGYSQFIERHAPETAEMFVRASKWNV